MFAEQFQDHDHEAWSASAPRCSFCEAEIGLDDDEAFIFEQGVGTSTGMCCGGCSHRMGITGTVDVCPFCLLPILGSPQVLSCTDEVVVCEHCLGILERMGLIE